MCLLSIGCHLMFWKFRSKVHHPCLFKTPSKRSFQKAEWSARGWDRNSKEWLCSWLSRDTLTLSQAPAFRDAKAPGCSGEPWTSMCPRYLHWPWWESKQLLLTWRGRGCVGLFARSPFHFYRVDRETIRRTSQRLWVLSTTAPVSQRVGVH